MQGYIWKESPRGESDIIQCVHSQDIREKKSTVQEGYKRSGGQWAGVDIDVVRYHSFCDSDGARIGCALVCMDVNDACNRSVNESVKFRCEDDCCAFGGDDHDGMN